MKKLIVLGLIVLTVGGISAKETNVSKNVSERGYTELSVVGTKVDLNEAEQAESDGCHLAGKVVEVIAIFLGSDKHKAEEIGRSVENLCNIVF